MIVEGTLRGTELAAPGSLMPKPLSNHRSRSVCYTDLDCNGHMNNARYLDWIDDLLPSDFHRDHPVKDFTLCYLNEAREGQPMELTWEVNDEGTLHVDIQRNREDDSGKTDRIFAARILFDNVVL